MKYLKVYGDPQLIINQVRGEYGVKNENIMSNYQTMKKIVYSLDGFYINYVPRHKKSYADSLVSLVATLVLLKKSSKHIIVAAKNYFAQNTRK